MCERLMQALKLVNDAVAQMNKMAARVKELEEENLKAKETENKLATAVQGKESAEQALLAGLDKLSSRR